MTSVDDLKKDLPDWPDEVVGEWLLYFVNDGLGWPPPDPYGDHRWGPILGQRPISWWKAVNWQLTNTSCAMEGFAPKSRGTVTTMIHEIDRRAADESTTRRFTSAFHHILDNASFPNAMSAMQTPLGLLVLDGHHRMSAFCSLQRMPDEWFGEKGKKKAAMNQSIWIARHPNNELPLT